MQTHTKKFQYNLIYPLNFIIIIDYVILFGKRLLIGKLTTFFSYYLLRPLSIITNPLKLLV